MQDSSHLSWVISDVVIDEAVPDQVDRFFPPESPARKRCLSLFGRKKLRKSSMVADIVDVAHRIGNVGFQSIRVSFIVLVIDAEFCRISPNVHNVGATDGQYCPPFRPSPRAGLLDH